MNVVDVLPRDAIPSIDEPRFGPSHFGEPTDEVVVVDGSKPRAFPIRVLSYHEVVNTAVDGRPVAVTWCPICWSAVVYDRRVDGRTLTLGVSGKLADDALVLYDRETGSEFKQTSGQAIAGQLSGARLDTLPSTVTTWGEFTATHPNGEVLQPVHDPSRYDMTPYEQYADGEAFGLYGMRGQGEQRAWERTDIEAKTVVLGIEQGGDAVGYPLPRVEPTGGVVTDTVGGTSVVVFAVDGRLHAFEHPGLSFEGSEGTFTADGATWDGRTGESDDGRQLTRLPARQLFAFAWRDDHGPDAFYEWPSQGRM